jgi:hypothetical protein
MLSIYACLTVPIRYTASTMTKNVSKRPHLNPAAKALLRELGALGGKTRAANMTPEERRASAIKASKAAAEARAKKASANKKRA